MKAPWQEPSELGVSHVTRGLRGREYYLARSLSEAERRAIKLALEVRKSQEKTYAISTICCVVLALVSWILAKGSAASSPLGVLLLATAGTIVLLGFYARSRLITKKFYVRELMSDHVEEYRNLWDFGKATTVRSVLYSPESKRVLFENGNLMFEVIPESPVSLALPPRELDDLSREENNNSQEYRLRHLTDQETNELKRHLRSGFLKLLRGSVEVLAGALLYYLVGPLTIANAIIYVASLTLVLNGIGSLLKWDSRSRIVEALRSKNVRVYCIKNEVGEEVTLETLGKSAVPWTVNRRPAEWRSKSEIERAPVQDLYDCTIDRSPKLGLVEKS